MSNSTHRRQTRRDRARARNTFTATHGFTPTPELLAAFEAGPDAPLETLYRRAGRLLADQKSRPAADDADPSA